MGILNVAFKQGEKALFNSKGYRLLKKQTNIPLSELGNITLPEGTKSCSFAKIETNYGKGMTKVFSFFDKDGRLIERYIDKTKGKNYFERTYSKYKGQFDWGFGRTKESVKTVNDVQVQNVNSTSFYDKMPGFLYREKLVRDINPHLGTTVETQTFENLAAHGRQQYMMTIANKKGDKIINRHILSNFISEGELGEIQKFPYLYYLNYTDEEFVKAIAPYAAKLQKVENRGVKLDIKELSGETLGLSYDRAKKVAVDVTKGSSKGRLVNTTNHEMRHQYQHQLVDQYENENQSLADKIAASIEQKRQELKLRWFEQVLNKLNPPPKPPLSAPKPLSEKEKEYARKCTKDFKNYVTPEENFDDYYRQFVEEDARLAGQIAQDEFQLGIKKIDSVFTRAQLDLLNWTKQQKDTANALYNKINSLFS